MGRRVRLVSIHDVLTSREAQSDPTAYRVHLPDESSSESEPNRCTIVPELLRKPAGRRRRSAS